MTRSGDSTTVGRRDLLKLAAAAMLGGATVLADRHSASAEARTGPGFSRTEVTTFAAMGPVRSTPSARFQSERFQAVARTVETAIAENHIPGAALGILADGVEEHAVFGIESIVTGATVTDATRFQIGSVTKTFTGTAVMRLVGEGRIDLDATLRTYLPSLRLADPSVADRVTVRHLLTHTAGWFGDSRADSLSDDEALARYVDEALPTFPQLFPLGAYSSYSNSGFSTLGRLIEVVTGRPYAVAMRELIFGPLGLQQTTLEHEVALAASHTEGHWHGARGTEVMTPLLIPKADAPAGGVWSTTPDLLRFARFHLGDGSSDGRQVMPRSTLRLMQQPWAALPGLTGLWMGMPWVVQHVDGLRVVSHSGDAFGQHADLFLAPDRGFAIAMLSNGQPGGWLAFQSVVSEAFTQYLGSSAGAAAGAIGALIAQPGTPTITLTTERLGEYVGRYSQPTMNIDIRLDGDRLLLSLEQIDHPGDVQLSSETPPPAVDVPLSFVDEDVAQLGPSLLPFVRRPDGRVGWLAVSLRLIPRQG
jgi:CubicO group peptidase (beta-lactamase class C family)